VAIDARFESTCKSKVFFTITRSTSLTRIVQEENETWGHRHKINLLSQMFLMVENAQ
jgi:DUF1365 family protein